MRIMTLNIGNVSIKNMFMIFLVINSFTWYFFAFTVLRNLVENASIPSSGNVIIWVLNFVGTAFSALSGIKIASWFKREVHFILIWLFFGFLSSLAPIFFINNVTTTNLVFVSILYGVSFGLGMPKCMEYFAEVTTIENRGRIGGISFFIVALGVSILSILSTENFLLEVLILAMWRGVGVLALFFVKPFEITRKENVPSYVSILSKRAFLLYIIPWWMFCLVNYITMPISNEFFGEDFVRFSSVIESLIISVFAVVAGYLADIIGRKRVAIVGFSMLGLGYAMLGIYPSSIFSWYFYTFMDGVAWGAFYVIFLIVLWGDLAQGAPSGNFYALGGQPFLLSNFLRIIVGSYVSETIPIYAIFSLASLFLFLAVFPLMYAPETLPEKAIRERELRSYIEKAKRLREKFT
ncbi:MAG: hypothetical protein QXK33_02435 [Candidatus Bathyarchaeia archaeon]